MAPIDRAVARADRRAGRIRWELGDEYREARTAAGWTQAAVAGAVQVSRSRYTRIEAGRVETLTIREAARIAAVLGHELSVRAYPSGGPLRDAGQSRLLGALLAHARPPLAPRTEVALPARDDRPEHRAWDAMLAGVGVRTAIEYEMRIRDAQALERRLALKRRDDPTDRFVLVVAGTRANRRVLAESPLLFADLPRLGPSRVIRPLRRGEHPPTCLVVL